MFWPLCDLQVENNQNRQKKIWENDNRGPIIFEEAFFDFDKGLYFLSNYRAVMEHHPLNSGGLN